MVQDYFLPQRWLLYFGDIQKYQSKNITVISFLFLLIPTENNRLFNPPQNSSSLSKFQETNIQLYLRIHP